jgi:hypothetical protein
MSASKIVEKKDTCNDSRPKFIIIQKVNSQDASNIVQSFERVVLEAIVESQEKFKKFLEEEAKINSDSLNSEEFLEFF